MKLIQQDLFEDSKPALLCGKTYQESLTQKTMLSAAFWEHLQVKGAELQPTGRKWPNAGCVFGPQRQVTWRILDAKFFGLAQRRKRVFVIASARAGCIPEILFERKGLHRDIEKSQSKREGIARNCQIYANRASETISGKTYTPPILASHGQKKWLGNQEAFCGDYYIKHAVGVGGCTTNAAISDELYPTLMANNDRGYVLKTYGIQGNIIGRSITAGGNGIGFKEEQAPTLTQMDKHGVLYCGTMNDHLRDLSIDIAPTLRTGGKGGGAINQAIFQFIPPYIFYLARYLTEIECERLQGFPDNYTNIPKAAATSRYKALGNSMAVTVMRWLGQRIDMFLRGAA